MKTKPKPKPKPNGIYKIVRTSHPEDIGASTTTWNQCDICKKKMNKRHYRIEIYKPDCESYQETAYWVCSPICANMFILQQI